LSFRLGEDRDRSSLDDERQDGRAEEDHQKRCGKQPERDVVGA